MIYKLILVILLMLAIRIQIVVIKRARHLYVTQELYLESKQNIKQTHLLLTKSIAKILVSLVMIAIANALLIAGLSKQQPITGNLVDVFVSIGMGLVMVLSIVLLLLGKKVNKQTHQFTSSYILGICMMYSFLMILLIMATIYALVVY